jgi:hypothetical protein
LHQSIEIFFHALLEDFQEVMEAGTTFGERETHYLDQKWHELIWYLSEEYSSFIAQGLQYGSRETEGRSW